MSTYASTTLAGGRPSSKGSSSSGGSVGVSVFGLLLLLFVGEVGLVGLGFTPGKFGLVVPPGPGLVVPPGPGLVVPPGPGLVVPPGPGLVVPPVFPLVPVPEPG